MPSMPQGDSGAVREAARLLANAERPLIRTGKLARTSAGWDRLLELAELLQAPVDVGGYGSWQDFPSWHALYGSGGPDYRPDVILGLEINDMGPSVRAVRPTGGKTISICAEYLSQGHNIHDFGNYAEVDVPIAADGEATLPSLIEEIRKQSVSSAARLRSAWACAAWSTRATAWATSPRRAAASGCSANRCGSPTCRWRCRRRPAGGWPRQAERTGHQIW